VRYLVRNINNEVVAVFMFKFDAVSYINNNMGLSYEEIDVEDIHEYM